MRKLVLLLLTAVAVIAVPAVPAAAATSVEVIATGLDNPRGLALGPGGLVMVAEAGRAGVGPCVIRTRVTEFCLSSTGAVTAIAAGRQVRVAAGLPSLGRRDGREVVGPHDLVLTSAGIVVSIGLGTDPARRAALGPDAALIGQVVLVTHEGHRAVADLAGYEGADNPDGGPARSNPYSLIAGTADGSLVATDAGGNDLLRIDRAGRVSTLAVLPDRPTRSVPTTAARGPDGAYYVAQRVGGASVWRVVPGEELTVAAGGFTNITDLAVDRQGRVLVLEAEALLRLERNGSRTEILRTGLVDPTGVAVAPDGTIYISNKGTQIGTGEVLKVRYSR